MSKERFIKFIPSEEALYLQKHHPNAMLLLMYIAIRARRISGKPDGLEIGEAHIGDYLTAGIETEKKYRTAKKILEIRGHIKICETCRNRKKRKNERATGFCENRKNGATEVTTGMATIGTKVMILDSGIWDINPESEGDRNGEYKGDRGATGGRGTRMNKNDKEEYKDIVPIDLGDSSDNPRVVPMDECNITYTNSPTDNTTTSDKCAQTTSSLRTSGNIFFSFDEKKFKNISEEDLSLWKQAYPAVQNIEQQLLRMTNWCLDNPAKAKSKKNWRKFITLWLSKNNEDAINKSAYQTEKKPYHVKNHEWVKNHFAHGEIYNGSECFISEKGIAFSRGMTHYQIDFKESGFQEQFINILRKLSISVHQMAI